MSDKVQDLLIPTSSVQVYNPSELLNIFSDILARQNTSSKVTTTGEGLTILEILESFSYCISLHLIILQKSNVI